MTILALDVGATKIAVGRIAQDGGAHDIRAISVPEQGIWDGIRRLLLEVARGEEIERIGIATAGPVHMADGVTAPINIPEWRAGFPLRPAVQELFGESMVGFAIDGVCATLAEKHYGALREVADALVLVVGSGIGGGIMVGGFTAVGRTGNAGHLGHIPVPGFDEECACGNRGCVEAVASGHSTVRWARRQGWPGNGGAELVAAARAGDRVCIDALHRSGTALGQAIVSAAGILDVDLVVVGGGFAQAGPLLWDPMRESVARNSGLDFLRAGTPVSGGTSGLRVVPSVLRETATLVGAGVLARMMQPVPAPSVDVVE
jgi:glucokinase